MDVRDFASRVLTVSGNQRITGPVKFLGNVKIRGSMNCPTIDGIVFSEFVKKIVTTNTPQIITGQLKFGYISVYFFDLI